MLRTTASGGEEFVVSCPETVVNGAAVLGEKNRGAIEDYAFPGAGRVTVSIVVSRLE